MVITLVGVINYALTSLPESDNPLVVPFTVEKINNALRATKKNKAPGTDGIPFEFYLKFWDVIGIHFLEMMKQKLLDHLHMREL